jgi:hypothetical protein
VWIRVAPVSIYVIPTHFCNLYNGE